MNITYKGQTGFILKGASESVAIACDPKQLSNENVIVTRTADETVKASKDQAVCDWPGEYEACDISVMIIPVGKEQKDRVTKAIFENIAFAHVDAISEPLSEKEEEKVGNIDVLFITTGKAAKLEPKQIQAVIESIGPRMVIPMNFAAGEQLEFAKLLGFGEITEDDTLKTTKSGLPSDRMDLRILSAK